MFSKYYKQMSSIHKNGAIVGNFSILHKVYKPSFRESCSREYYGQKEGDVITVLYDNAKHEVVMSDSAMEKRTNLDFVQKSNGNVLIGGLGIGMIILAIQDNPNVKSITVVELEKDIIDLVLPSLPLNDKVKIINCNIHDFKSEEKFDVVYCDIWNDVCGDNYAEMKKLTAKFKNKLNRDNTFSFIDHWRKKDTIKLSKDN